MKDWAQTTCLADSQSNQHTRIFSLTNIIKLSTEQSELSALLTGWQGPPLILLYATINVINVGLLSE